MKNYLFGRMQDPAERLPDDGERFDAEDLLGLTALGKSWQHISDKSFNIFRDIQKIGDSKSEFDDAELRSRLLTESSRYLQLLDETYQFVFESLEYGTATTDEEFANLQTELNHLKYYIFIWRLFLIVFMERLKDSPFEASAKYILRLASFRDSLAKPLKQMPESLPDARTSQTRNSSFWHSVRRFIMIGEFSEALRLLTDHERDDGNGLALQYLIAVLEKHPLLRSDALSEESVLEWRIGVNELLNNEDEVRNSPEISQLFRILLGEIGEWTKFGFEFTSWISFYISRLIHFGEYVAPTALAHNLTLISEAYAACPDRSFPPAVDLILESIIKLDGTAVFGTIRSFFHSTWFTVHAFDLLYHSGALHFIDPRNSEQFEPLRETIICEYVHVNVSRGSWLPFVQYLKYCPSKSESVLKDLLSQFSFPTQEMRFDVEEALKSANMESALMELHRHDAVEAMELGDYQVALRSAALTDEDFLNFVANRYLDHLRIQRRTIEITDSDKPLLALLPEKVLLRLGVPGFFVAYEQARKYQRRNQALNYLILLSKRVFDRNDVYYVIHQMNSTIAEIRGDGDDFDAEAYRQIRQLLMRLPLTNLKATTDHEKDELRNLEQEVFGTAAWSLDEYSVCYLNHHSAQNQEEKH